MVDVFLVERESVKIEIECPFCTDHITKSRRKVVRNETAVYIPSNGGKFIFAVECDQCRKSVYFSLWEDK